MCTACLGREDALNIAAPVNLLWALQEHPSVCWNVVFFGEDGAIADRFMSQWAAAFYLSILRVGSGGQKGLEKVGQSWPGPSTVNDRTVLKHWHASIGKNTSHMFAMEQELAMHNIVPPTEYARGGFAPCTGDSSSSGSGGGGSSSQMNQEDILKTMQDAQKLKPNTCLLVNLDADNIMGSCFLSTLTTISQQKAVCGWLVHCASKQGGTCGRMACWAEDWCLLRGYDQEEGILGSGSQDIDLRNRLKALSKSVNDNQAHVTVLKELTDTGAAVENLPYSNHSPKQDRGVDKICNCHPDAIAAMGNKWTSFNNRNWELMTVKERHRTGPKRNNLGGSNDAVGAFCVLLLPN